MNQTCIPTAIFMAEDTIYGKVYHPANQNAKDLCAIAGVVKMPEDRMPYVRRFFQVLDPNGQPLPHPYQKPKADPMHLRTDA